MGIPLGAVYIDALLEAAVSAPPETMLVANMFPANAATDVPQASNLGSFPIQLSVFDAGPGMPQAGPPAGTANTRVWVTADGTRLLVLEALGSGITFHPDWSTGSLFSAVKSEPLAGPYDEHRIVLIRDSAFLSQDTITVEVAAINLAGASVSATYTFAIEDKTAPQLISAKTQGLDTVRLHFDENMLQDTGTFGDVLRIRDISGGITVAARDGIVPPRIIAPSGVFEAADVGQFIGVAGATNALNNTVFTILSLIDSKTVEIDNELVVSETLPLDQIVTISPYRLVGVSDSGRVLPFFVPLVVDAEPVLGTQQEIDLLLHTEVTPEYSYDLQAVAGLLDQALNPLAATTVSFVSELIGAPPGRLAARFNYLNFIPEENLREDASRDLERFIRCLDEVLQLLLRDIDRFTDLVDIDHTDAENLSALLAHLGSPFTFTDSLNETDQRLLAASLVDIYKRKGLETSIEALVSFVLGIAIDVVPYSCCDHVWTLGESELGEDTYLALGSQFLLYSFEVISPIVLTETQRRRLIEIVNYMKPAHTHFVRLVEPGVPPPPTISWIIDVSKLGEDTVLT